MADLFTEPPMVLTIELPPQPPDGSIVLVRGPDGNVWQRKDDERWRDKHWGPNWFPACKWFDHRLDESHRNPLTWEQFIAYAREIHILRWGDGKPPKEGDGR